MCKKQLSLFMLVLSIFLFSGCATHIGFMSSSASLSSNNFKIVSTVDGSANTTVILGIGGLEKNALVAEAKRNLLMNHPLKEYQTLANVSVDFKTSFYFVLLKQQATVTADVVEFIGNE